MWVRSNMNPQREYALHVASTLVGTDPKKAFEMVLAAMGARLDSGTRREANELLRRAGFDGNSRFRSIGQALNKAFSALAQVGIEQDETLSAHLFRDPSGSRALDIAFTNKEDPFSPEPITNSVLHFAWTELRDEVYEVVAYLS